MALSGTITKTLTSYHWLKIEWSGSQSVSGNYTTITAKLYLGGSGYISDGMSHTARIIIDGSTYSKSVNYTVARNETKLLMTASKTVYHNSDGTKTVSISGNCDIELTLSSTWFGKGVIVGPSNFTLNTIPRASDFTVSNFTIGDNMPVVITRASTAFTHTFSIHCNGEWIGEWLTRVGTSTTLIINETHQNRIYERIPSATSAKITFYCHTYNGDTFIGTKSKTVTAYVGSNIVPIFNTITHSENVSNIATVIGKYVQGLSKLNLAITGAAGAKYSTIKSYVITFEGINYNAQSAVTGVIKGSGDLTITGKVTDSRGRTCTKSVTVNVLPYSAPKITSFSLQRCTADGTPDVMGEYVKVTRTGSVSSLVNVTQRNTLTYRIKSKARSDSTWTTKKEQTISGISLTGNDIIGGYLATTPYDFRLEITDKFKASVAINTLPTAEVPMSWSKTGIGVGKIWEQGALDVGGDVYINNALAGYVVESGSNENGRWIRFSDGTQICYYSGPKSIAINNSYGTLYQGTYTYGFPISFASIPAVSVGQTQWGTGASWGIVSNVATSSVTLRFIDAFNRTAASMDISYIAIGRWK